MALALASLVCGMLARLLVRAFVTRQVGAETYAALATGAGVAAPLLATGRVVTGLLVGAIATVALSLWSNRQPAAPAVGAIERAAEMLGVPVEAGENAIRAAFRARMTQAHPDAGGSHDRAAALAWARDTLLAEAQRRATVSRSQQRR